MVVWQDAESTDSWSDITEFQLSELPNIYSVGFLLQEDKDKILLVMNLDPKNEKASMSTLIPRKWIKKIL